MSHVFDENSSLAFFAIVNEQLNIQVISEFTELEIANRIKSATTDKVDFIATTLLLFIDRVESITTLEPVIVS